MYFEPLDIFNFSKEQLDELYSILVVIPDYKLPKSEACFDSVEIMRYHYISQKAKEIVRRDSQEPIKNKFAYLKKMMKQDALEESD